MGLSQSQLTKLGERLKAGPITPDDLQLLEDYRRSFAGACDEVVQVLRNRLGLQPSIRAAKTTQAIVEKLARLNSRLGQIQDIAGCRVVLGGVDEQDLLVRRLQELFPDCRIEDRRLKPSHGYRAVHLVVRVADRWVEIQVRTQLQHLWASLSEKLADAHGQDIKYGNGDSYALEVLKQLSQRVDDLERGERLIAELRLQAVQVGAPPEVHARLAFSQQNLRIQREDFRSFVEEWGQRS